MSLTYLEGTSPPACTRISSALRAYIQIARARDRGRNRNSPANRVLLCIRNTQLSLVRCRPISIPPRLFLPLIAKLPYRVGRKIRRAWRQNSPETALEFYRSPFPNYSREQAIVESCLKTPESSGPETLAAFLSSRVFMCTCNFSGPERSWTVELFWQHLLMPIFLIPVLSSRTIRV